MNTLRCGRRRAKPELSAEDELILAALRLGGIQIFGDVNGRVFFTGGRLTRREQAAVRALVRVLAAADGDGGDG